MIDIKPREVINLNIPVQPMGAVRMTGRGKYVKDNAKRYMAYKTHLQWMANMQLKGHELFEGSLFVRLTFFMPIPQSMRGKERNAAVNGGYHKKKPDIDNLIKGVFDALNGVAWKDDNQVSKVEAEKIYGPEPGIKIEVMKT